MDRWMDGGDNDLMSSFIVLLISRKRVFKVFLILKTKKTLFTFCRVVKKKEKERGYGSFYGLISTILGLLMWRAVSYDSLSKIQGEWLSTWKRERN